MSATIDTKLFLNFFDGFRVNLLQIPGRTFPVNDFYLEDVIEATGHVIEENSYFSLKEDCYMENESSIWITTKGGGKERVSADTGDAFNVSDMYSKYSLSTRRYVTAYNFISIRRYIPIPSHLSS
jgi:ATP-dependent RNA helicase DHX29